MIFRSDELVYLTANKKVIPARASSWITNQCYIIKMRIRKVINVTC
jgi:hypothetical protein